MVQDQRPLTAKIYEFPRDRRVRGAGDARPADVAAAKAPRVDYEAWYHAAAVEEGDRARKR